MVSAPLLVQDHFDTSLTPGHAIHTLTQQLNHEPRPVTSAKPGRAHSLQVQHLLAGDWPVRWLGSRLPDRARRAMKGLTAAPSERVVRRDHEGGVKA